MADRGGVFRPRYIAPPRLQDPALGILSKGATLNAWNKNDKSATITLSDADKTATLSSGVNSAVRSTTQNALGGAIHYAEIKVNAMPFSIGLRAAGGSITDPSAAFNISSATGTISNGIVGVGTIGALAVNDVVCIALRAGKVWVRKNGGLWQDDPAADPATNTNGMTNSFGGYLWFLSATLNASVTVRTELAEFTQAVPTNFTSWMGEVNPIANAVGAATGTTLTSAAVGAAVVDYAWNSTDTSNVTLSITDTRATAVDTNPGGVRSATRQLNGSVGKWYAELRVQAIGGTLQVGIYDLLSTPQASSRAIVDQAGNVKIAGITQGSTSALAANDVLGIAWDTGAEQIWFRLNNGLWNEDAGSDPVAGTVPYNGAPLTSANHALGMNTNSSSANSVDIHTRLADFTYVVPSGFFSWMGEVPTSAGAAAGTSTVAATGAAIKPADGVAAGTSTVAALSISETTGTAAASGVATGAGTALLLSQGTGAGSTVATATGQALTLVTGDGATAGTSTVAATGDALAPAAGTIASTSTAASSSSSAAAADGAVAGTSTVTAAGTGVRDGVGAIAGAATISGQALSLTQGIGAAAGTASVAAGYDRGTPPDDAWDWTTAMPPTMVLTNGDRTVSL